MRKRAIRGTCKKNCSKCNKPLEEVRVGKYRYCNECHAKYMRLRRKSYGELNEEERKRLNARSYLHVYVKRGKVKKLQCENCGSSKSEAHHADYSQPLVVTWLCRQCHLLLHKNKSDNIDME